MRSPGRKAPIQAFLWGDYEAARGTSHGNGDGNDVVVGELDVDNSWAVSYYAAGTGEHAERILYRGTPRGEP